MELYFDNWRQRQRQNDRAAVQMSLGVDEASKLLCSDEKKQPGNE